MATAESSVSRAASRTPRPGLLLCCVLVAVLASYVPVMGGPFVWDDHHLVEESPLVQTLHPLSAYFVQGFWQADDVEPGRTYYRPLAILSLALDEKLYADNSAGFHLTNLLVHLLSTCLLFLLLRARRAGPYAASLATALWALHPRLTEAVAWISGRTDVLATCFVLCALLTQRSRGWLGRTSTALFLLLGLLSKEVALAGVAAVLTLELLDSSSIRERAKRALPTLLALICYLALRAHALGQSAQEQHPLAAEAALPASLATLGHYLFMLCDPWFPKLQIGRLAHPEPSYVAFGCLGLITTVVVLVRERKRLTPELASALALVAVGLGLVLHLLPISINVLAADRFLYLPLVGIVLAGLPALALWRRPALVAAAASVLAISFAIMTFERANVWSDEVRLWTTAFGEVDEDPSLASIELGRLYARAGLLPFALSVYGHALNPEFMGYPVALNNAASVLARSGRYGDAAALLSSVEAQFPEVPLFAFNQALFESYLAHFDLARMHLAHALAAFPDYPQGNALAAQLPSMERERLELDALPADASPLVRARLLEKLGLAAESTAAWQRAMASPALAQKDFEEGLWFALRQADEVSLEAMFREYRTRFSQQDEHLNLAYEAHSDLVRRLRDAWPGLRLKTPPMR